MIRKLFIICFFLLISAALFAQNQAVITELAGKVEIRFGTGTWQPARTGLSLSTGTYISTGFNSIAVLDLAGSILQVKPLTRMQIQELAEKEGTLSTELFLRVGKVKAEVKSVEGLTQDFKLRSPVSTAAVRGTEFEFDGVTVTVINGMVSFSNTYNQTRSVGGSEDSSTNGTDLPSQGNQGKSQRSTVSTNLSPTGQGALNTPGAPVLEKTTVTVIWNW
jgi:hypothetical protein